MGAVVVVDANVILSALLGGKPDKILFDDNFQFVTAEFTLNEIRKYIPRLARKLSLPEYQLNDLFSNLPIFVYGESFYRPSVKRASRIMAHIDKKDVPILALAIRLRAPLWSQDKHFEKSGYRKILKTRDFL